MTQRVNFDESLVVHYDDVVSELLEADFHDESERTLQIFNILNYISACFDEYSEFSEVECEKYTLVSGTTLFIQYMCYHDTISFSDLENSFACLNSLEDDCRDFLHYSFSGSVIKLLDDGIKVLFSIEI